MSDIRDTLMTAIGQIQADTRSEWSGTGWNQHFCHDCKCIWWGQKKALECGMDGFLTKPIVIEELISTLQKKLD